MVRRAALASALFLSFAACSSSPSLQSCVSDADCGPGDACVAGSCGGNEPPTAVFPAPVGATTHRLVSLLASSTDPEGRSVEHRWSIRAVTALCDPEPEPPGGSSFDVVFWCPGTYEATLTPVDDAGLEGAPVTRSFDVVAAAGAPEVTVEAAVAAGHACNLDLPSCHATAPDGSSELQLRANGSSPGGGELTYEWTAFPPEEVVAAPGLEVVFLPGSRVDAPRASISNAGGPISGRYRFRVRARNVAGLLAQAYQEVIVENRPPTAAPGVLVVPHRYVDGLYVAEGDVDTTATDPDGDPLVAAGALSPAPPAGCEEEVSPGVGGRVHVRIACSLAEGLIGAAPRTLAVAVADANGGSTSFTASLEIGNRPPELALHPDFGDGGYALDHRVAPCAIDRSGPCFVAESGDPFVATDPDGDPMHGYALSVRVDAGLPASRASVAVAGASYRLHYETATSAPAQFRQPDGSSGFWASASISDSLGGVATHSAQARIRNGAPVLREAVPTAQVDHRYDAATRRYLASVQGPVFEDPDGDPITVGVSRGGFCGTATLAGGRATIGCERIWDYSLGGIPPFSAAGFSGPTDVTASDGWQTAVSTTEVTILDRPATVSAPSTVIENCYCKVLIPPTSVWAASLTDIELPLVLEDPDGDPAQITVKATGPDASAPTVATHLPGWLTHTFSSKSGTVQVYATSTAAAPALVLSLTVTTTCSLAPTRCP